MNLKVPCVCGARYSFDVEPVEGRMPFAVQCPSCGADGTEAANALIAEAASGAPKLRVAHAVPVPAAHPGAVSSTREAEMTRRAVVDMLSQRKEAEQRSYRWGVRAVAAVAGLAVVAAAFWGWYWFVGSKPVLIYSTSVAGDEAAAQFIGPQQFLVADNSRAVLHDLKAGKDLWTAELGGAAGSRKPQIFAQGASVWICLANAVVQIDRSTGGVKNNTAIAGTLESFTPNGTSMLVVSAIDPTTRRVLRIDLTSGQAASQDITVPRSEKHEMPNELPPNVQPTAAVLLAQALEEKKFNKPLDAMSSQFYSTGENLAEFRVQLVEPNVVYVASIKPKGKSLINGETTASTSAFGVTDEVFNDIKRSETGGVKPVDQSRYAVKIRRWTGGAQPLEWSGESVGLPGFFPLKTVDLLAAGKTLVVFDKQNKKLFEASLTYPVAERFVAREAAEGTVPAVEGPGGLYFFDQGVLTAFSLPDGRARWRVPTIGVTKLQFDAKGMLYVDSTTAAPEDIQFSDQISFNKIRPVLLKIDPQNGQILWQMEGRGQDCFVSGKFLYATSANMGGVPIAMALGEALGNQPPSDEPTHFHLFGLDPETGRTLWDVYHQGEPEDLTFQDNRFVLCYGHDVQAWRFLSF